MAFSTRATRFRFWLWLIRVIGLIVPRRLRADWKQEWQAELRNREALLVFEWQSGLAFRTNGMRGTLVGGLPDTRGASMFRYDIFEKLRQSREQAPDGPLTDFFAFAPIYELTAVVREQAEIISGQAVSGGYFDGLGVRPLLGRAIADADDNAASPPVVVLSHRYWEERFGANPDARSAAQTQSIVVYNHRGDAARIHRRVAGGSASRRHCPAAI